MAARLSPKHDEMTRNKIRTSQIVNRLQAFVFGEPDPMNGKPVQMTRDQLTAATTLLSKTLPALSNVEMSGEGGGPLVVEIVKFGGKAE